MKHDFSKTRSGSGSFRSLRLGLVLLSQLVACNSITGAGDLTVEGSGGAGGTASSGSRTTTNGVTNGATSGNGSTSGAGGATNGATSGNGATSVTTGASTSGATTTSAATTGASTSAATSVAASTSAAATSSSGGPAGPQQDCVDDINKFRATLGLPAYARWNAEETCGDGQAKSDSMSGQAHGAFGQCNEWAQNECPGWPGPPGSMIGDCLQMMWNEGPGADFSQHGHYINMSSTMYTMVACGFYTLADGSVWAVQDFQ